ncbi:nicotinamide-nucleotide adenylyltransferase [Myxococcus phage Mx1]|nr:nicotinamide-nucleotide adenylyltransferase [Myxococcus phage Mx1]
MTKIINLYGGPGTGKSTSAAYLFYKLKQAGFSVELVREYVKNWAWEKRHISIYDQYYFMGKQIRHESLLFGKVDFIVTDCPVNLSRYYAEKYSPPKIRDGVVAAVEGYYAQCAQDGYEHIHVFMERSKPYNPEGRFQTQGEALVMDAEIRLMLHRALNGAWTYQCATDDQSLDSLFKSITTNKE